MNHVQTIFFIMSFCNSLHGPDTFSKRNYEHYACSDQIKRCAIKAKSGNKELSVCLGEYIKKNYRKKR